MRDSTTARSVAILRYSVSLQLLTPSGITRTIEKQHCHYDDLTFDMKSIARVPTTAASTGTDAGVFLDVNLFGGLSLLSSLFDLYSKK